MRALLKLILLVVLFAVLYHFYGPQIDHFWAQTKASFNNFVSKEGYGNENTDQDHKYFNLEKRDEKAPQEAP